MRTRTLILTGALLLASSGLAVAQQTPTQTQTQTAAATAPAPFTPKVGQFDFGFRANDVKGDDARYNRFRDLRGGPVFDAFRFNREEATWLFRAEANNVGYRDQRYFADVRSIGKLKASFEWNQIPLYSARDQKTLYKDLGNGVVGIDDSIQLGIQNAVGVPARDAAITAAFATASRADLRSRRDVGALDMVYSFNRDVDFKFNLKNTTRSGNQVMAFGFGTSPGLNPAVEFGVPLDDRTTDMNGVLEFANTKGLLSVGYNGSWYNQNVPFVRFDNPLRATDISAGPSVGQLAWWPTNASFSVNANGAYNLARRTRANVGVSIGRWSQNEALPPMTVNTALVSLPLQRATADTQADIKSIVFNLNSSPVNSVWLNAKYRYYDYDNKTPHFTTTNAIIGDWAAGTQIHEIEPSSFKRANLDLDAAFTPVEYLSFGVGFGREDADRTWRIYEKTEDNTFRVSVDSTANQYVTLRTKYEYSTREGSGFDGHLLEEVAEQPEMRHYDIANRKRSRATAILSITPIGWLSLNGSASMGKDEYDETGFGLRDNENNAYGVGFDVMPNDMVNFGVNYGHEKYTAYQYSRTSNPLSPTNLTFLDPTRDWSIDQDDTVNTFTANLDLMKALPKTDIRLSYDLSDGDATYVYGGPATTNPAVFTTIQLQQLSPVKNTLTGAKADVQYFVRHNVALGFGYWFEQYKVEDFALGEATINQPNPVNGTTGVFASTIYSGYLYRPYKAHTGWLRMTYLW